MDLARLITIFIGRRFASRTFNEPGFWLTTVIAMHIRNVTLFVSLLIALSGYTQAVSANERSEPSQGKLEINKAQARRVYEEGLSQGLFETPYTANFIGHGGGRSTFNHDQGMTEAKGWRKAFPDLDVTVDLIVAEGDLVSVRWTARGTNSAAGNGIPATGKSVETSGTTIFRFENGAIAEEWTAGDALGLLRQLGLLPTPGAAPTP